MSTKGTRGDRALVLDVAADLGLELLTGFGREPGLSGTVDGLGVLHLAGGVYLGRIFGAVALWHDGRRVGLAWWHSLPGDAVAHGPHGSAVEALRALAAAGMRAVLEGEAANDVMAGAAAA